jgi:hypothetical protein
VWRCLAKIRAATVHAPAAGGEQAQSRIIIVERRPKLAATRLRRQRIA